VDERDGREVALKLLSAGSDSEVASRRFRREFRAAARLRHPHVAAVYDLHAEPPLYYTMELVRGLRLDRLLRGDREALAAPGRCEHVKTVLAQILVALDA